jgi:protein-disulfide isomerase
LSKSDDLKIIYKNFPILSEDSVKLAKYAIILSEIDNKKFIDFHNFVISNKGQLKDKDLDKLFMKLNVVRDEVDKKLNDSSVLKILKNDIQLAQNLGLRGTPAFIINNEIIFGYINYEDMLSKLN